MSGVREGGGGPGECELGGIEAPGGPQELLGLVLTDAPGLWEVRAGDQNGLLRAAVAGQAERVRWLLGRGADPQAASGEGLHALEGAASQGHLAVVEILLAHDGELLELPGSGGRSALLAAVAGAHTAVVEHLLAQTADPRRWATDGTWALDQAAQDGHQGLVERLLAHDPGLLDLPGRGERSALCAAAGAGHLDVVDALLRGGTDARAEAADGTRALDHAARGGHLPVVKRLLAHVPGLLDLPGYAGQTALMAAAAHGHADLTRWLLAAGADATVCAADGTHAFELAARHGHLAVLEPLHGHDPLLLDLPGQGGDTALVAAAAGGHTVVVQWLLACGADPCSRSAAGGHALEVAAEAGHPAVLECLLAHDPRLRDLPGRAERTALAAAAGAGHTDLVRHLLARGADARVRQAGGRRALDSAARTGQTAVVEQLLGFDPWLLDMPGEADATALCAAAERGHVATVRALLARGADPRRRGEDGRHPLEAAARGGHLAVVDVLLAHFALVCDLPGHGGQTALCAAAAHGHSALVGRLLARGADPRVRDAGGANVLHRAARHGHAAVVIQLLESDPDLLDLPVVTPVRLPDVPRWLPSGGPEGRPACGLGLMETLLLARRAPLALALLRQHRGRINKAGIGGTTALMLCAATAQDGLLRWLLANGADARARDQPGNHALLHALDQHAYECARLLLGHDPALAHLPGQDGRTAAAVIGERLAAAAAPALAAGPRALQGLIRRIAGGAQ